jgi:TatD DNase family protein
MLFWNFKTSDYGNERRAFVSTKGKNNLMIFVDTHIHLDDPKFESDREELVKRAGAAGVKFMVTIGTQLQDSLWAADYAETRDYIFATAGIHPQFSDKFEEKHEACLSEVALRKKVVAIGEVGLDYHHPDPDPVKQQLVFRKMICLAKKMHKPLIIHQREAATDTVKILDEEKGWECGGIFHCFAGDKKMAEIVTDNGMYVAVGGIITFRNAEALREVFKTVPIERIVLETDAPWLAPQVYRGQRNEPAWLTKIAEALSVLKGISLEEIASITTQNAGRAIGVKF